MFLISITVQIILAGSSLTARKNEGNTVNVDCRDKLN
jgi:hypothetical protein